MSLLRVTMALTLGAALGAPGAHAYSVLTHEAIIDSNWNQNLAPLVLARFPGTTPEQLQQARAYAYGGCIIQDMGYYPFGSKFFTNLAHYVRSGDFVLALLREAQDPNEFAFALGALAHYAADTDGHAFGVNHAVPALYPVLRRRYGNIVTYEDNPTAHLKTEFSFDVVQAATGEYLSPSYHNFIGFQVAKPVLERAFRDTYGLNLDDLFTSLDLALGTYRFTVSSILPEATKVAWALERKEIVKTHPGLERRHFVYRMSRSQFRKEYGKQYRAPGWFARFLGMLMRIIPKIGPLSTLQFRPPTPATEQMFRNSFQRSVNLCAALVSVAGARSAATLADLNLDTGHIERPGQYRMADEAYATLLCRLAQNHFQYMNAGLRANLLAFFAAPQSANTMRRHRKQWRQTMQALAQLQALPATPAAAASGAGAAVQ